MSISNDTAVINTGCNRLLNEIRSYVELRLVLTVSVLEDILDLPTVIGVKEESGKGELYESILAAFNDKWAIIGAGGAMDRYLTDSELGATTYLVGIGSFLPDLAL